MQAKSFTQRLVAAALALGVTFGVVESIAAMYASVPATMLAEAQQARTVTVASAK